MFPKGTTVTRLLLLALGEVSGWSNVVPPNYCSSMVRCYGYRPIPAGMGKVYRTTSLCPHSICHQVADMTVTHDDQYCNVSRGMPHDNEKSDHLPFQLDLSCNISKPSAGARSTPALAHCASVWSHRLMHTSNVWLQRCSCTWN